MSVPSNPRRTAVTRSDSTSNGLSLKTTNLALRKGATFHHSPTTPPASPLAVTFRVPSLPQRSQTNLDDVVDASRRRMEMTLGPIESTLTTIKAERSTSPSSFRDDSQPFPQGVLEHMVADTMTQEPSFMDKETEKRSSGSRLRRSTRYHESDSGLGTSIASQATKASRLSVVASAITRSAAATGSENLPRLRSRAVNRIHEHTLRPLLAKPSLKEFHPIINDCPRRIQESSIVCLRDLEKTLLFMAPERAKSAELFLDFCLTSIRCIQATVEYLTDREQTRPHDRPYSNGYFIDLVEQIRQHAREMQAARERQSAGEELGETDVNPTDEIKLMGGLSTNGRPAELVRINKKTGKAISIATGERVENLDEEDDTEGPIRFKRSMSETLKDEEEIMRSMARRKKNASPEELAPKKCKEPGCNKEFKRPCDLTKHEKTHSRPWKCHFPTCKYNSYGWPTEKEMDRHVNDKHSTAPPMYACRFKPCPYKSKRESNCKQHMEKAHGWTYVRTKTNGKKGGSTAGSSTHHTPLVPSIPTQISDDQNINIMTPPEEPNNCGGYSDIDFPTCAAADDMTLFEPMPYGGDLQLDHDYSPMDNGTPSTDAGQFNAYQEPSPDFTDIGQFEDIYGAHVQLPTPTHSVYNKGTPQVFPNFASDLCHAHAPTVPHISPVGQGNTMLYTPSSLADVDEGFDEFPANDQLGADFLLFPPGDMKQEYGNNLFQTPSAAAGFSQPSSQFFNIDYSTNMEWADYNGDYHIQQ